MALVLSRRPGEKILIGDNIVITLQGYNGNAAVIAIDAPKEVNIVREEIQGRKFTPKAPSEASEKKKAPFLKAHKSPKFESKPRTALGEAVDAIKEEVKALSS